MSENGTLSNLLDQWRAGDQSAATDIYQRYEKRLLRLVDHRMGRHLQARVDPEDVMLSVLDTVLVRIAKGQYSVSPAGTLWNLLQFVANNKIRKQAEFHGAGKRDVQQEIGGNADEMFQSLSSDGPGTDDAALLADELARIRERLSPADFEILDLRLQGLGNPDIAERLGCARQTVRYKANRMDERLRAWADSEDG